MLIKMLSDVEIPNMPMLKSGESYDLSVELGMTLVGRGVAEGTADKGYETQELSPKKRKVK